MTFVDRLLRRATRSRRLVLGLALAMGLACALAVGENRSHFDPPLIGDAFAADRVRILVADDTKAAEPPTTEKAETPGKSRPSVDAEISISESGVTIRKRGGNDDRHVVVDDMEFESFEEFVEKAPWLAALVFMVTGLVFLMPLLIIGLIVWYKVRSNRMRNETMLKLAERGVVTPTEAVTAMAAGSSAPSFATMPSTAPLYEQVKQVRKRAAWSDLRKGVIMFGIGLGLSFWSMLDDGSANALGLVLLFVGIGFIVLWYFEERQMTPPRDAGPGTPGGA